MTANLSKVVREFRMRGAMRAGNGEQQVRFITELVERRIDGIGISVENMELMAPALKKAKDADIPVVTFDADLNDERLRDAYVGTDNYRFGVKLAELVMKLKPNGG